MTPRSVGEWNSSSVNKQSSLFLNLWTCSEWAISCLTAMWVFCWLLIIWFHPFWICTFNLWRWTIRIDLTEEICQQANGSLNNLPAGRSVSLLGFRTMNNMFSGRTTGEACATIRAGRSLRPHKPLASSTVTEYRLDDEDMRWGFCCYLFAQQSFSASISYSEAKWPLSRNNRPEIAAAAVNLDIKTNSSDQNKMTRKF